MFTQGCSTKSINTLSNIIASDHNILQCELNCSMKVYAKRRFKRINFKAANWKNVAYFIRRAEWGHFFTCEQPDTQLQLFYDNILPYISENFPLRTCYTTYHQNCIPTNCRNKLKDLTKKCHKTKNFSTLTRINEIHESIQSTQKRMQFNEEEQVCRLDDHLFENSSQLVLSLSQFNEFPFILTNLF